MFSKSLHKSVIYITLLSVILQSFAPFPLNESRVTSPQTVGAVAVPSIEPSSYQAPVFQHPEPRAGIHSIGVSKSQNGSQNSSVESEQVPAIPLIFIENVGEFDNREIFRAYTNNGIIHFAKEAIWITVLDTQEIMSDALSADAASLPATPTPNPDLLSDSATKKLKGTHLKLSFQNLSSGLVAEGFNSVDTKFSFFTGDNPDKWRSDVPAWQGIRYKDIYPGIDLEVQGEMGALSWSFVVHENSAASASNMNEILMKIDGADSLTMDGSYLKVHTKTKDIVLPTPSIKLKPKNINSSTKKTSPKASVSGSNFSIPFSVPTNDLEASETDSIQSGLSQTTLSSSSQLTSGLMASTVLPTGDGKAITRDSSGYVYVTGTSFGGNFPTTPGAFQSSVAGYADIVVSKFDSTLSTLIYSTMIGGSDLDESRAIEVDSSGSAYITGFTFSTNYPVTSGALDQVANSADAIITKLSSNGTQLVYSTYLGGSNGEQGFDIQVDSTGNAYIVGQTYSTNFPVTANAFDTTANGGWDGFISKLNSTGSQLVYSTYFGGSGADCEFGGNLRECTLAVDKNGAIYVGGVTFSSNFPITSGAYDYTYNGAGDPFVFKLNSTGSSLVFSTFLGNSATECVDWGCILGIDGAGSTYIAGTIANGPNGGTDIFITKLNSTGSGIAYTKVIGGSGNDNLNDITVDDLGHVSLIGNTYSSNFPTTLDAFQSTRFGIRDAFVVQLAGETITYSSYLGGNNDEIGFGIAQGGNDSILLTGWTSSGDFPTTPGVYNETPSGGDLFITRLSKSTQVSENSILSSSWGLDGNLSCIAPCTQGYEGGPINTRTGSYDYLAADITIRSGAGDISFERTYSSFTKDLYTTKLGHGWTHNHDLYLSIGTYSNGVRQISLKGQTANQFTFSQQANATSTISEPGVYATLVQGPSSFILTDKAQGQYEFNLTTGRLISHTNPTGQKILYTYDSKGRLTKISDQSGQRYLTLAYSGNGTRIVSLTDHTGRKVSYGYDSNNNLVSVTDTLGKIWRYTYDSSHRILQVLDPNNAIIERTEYDAQGRAVRQYDGENNLVVELIYNADGTTTVKDALNQTETHVYDSRKTLKSQTDPIGAATSKTYDSNFRPTTITDENGNSTSLVWDARGADLLQVKDALNGTVSLTYDANHKPLSVVDQNNHLTTYTYSGVNLTSMTDALNATWSYTYTTQGYLASQTDPLGRTTSYTYNAQGQRLSMTDPLGKTWNYAYDNLGRLITTTDPLGRVTRNEYDALGQLLKVTRNYNANHPQNYQNQWNIVTQYQYNARRNQTATIDTYGQTTSYQYDIVGRLIKTTDPAGGITFNTYDARGQLKSVTDALGRVTRYEYDAAGRVISVTDPLGNVTSTTYNLDGTIATTRDALNRVTSYSYDELKRIESITNPMGGVTSYTYDAAGNMTAVTDPRGATTAYEYDALGRLIRQIAPNGGMTETFYDAAGNRIQTIDPRGHATTYTYDGANRLLTITDARGGVTRYAYDDLGRRISTTDANNRTTTYAYDALDRVVSTTDPLGNISQAQYNAVGSAVSQTDANNNTTTFQYDALYRLVTQTNALNGATQFTYDLADNQLTVKNPNNQTVTTTYDALNRPVSVLDANGNSTSAAYDAVGNLVSATDGLGNTTTFGYDALNRQVSLADALGNLTQYGYNAAGERISVTDANGIVTRFEYNNMGWLTAVIENYKPSLQPDNETNVRTEYTYDLNGNRLTIKDGRGQVSSFTYDELNRLVQESDPLGNTWTYYYDATGSQTSIVDANGATTQFAYDNANRLVGIDYPGGTPDVTFAYDAGGRRTTMTDGAGTTSWTFDNLNRPTAIQDPFGVTVGYGYDAAGNRTSLTYPGAGTVTYTYDAGNRLAAVSSDQFSVTGYQYDSANRLTGISRPNGVNTTYAYDSANRLLALAHTLGGQDIALYQYAYNAVGNRTQAIESVAFPEGAFPTLTPAFTETPAITPTTTPTMTLAETETSEPTVTDLPSATPTEIFVATNTPTFSPTETPTSTIESPTETATEVSFNGGVYFVSLAKAPKATRTPKPTNTPNLPTATPTSSVTSSHTPSPTAIGPTNTPTITNTPLPPPVLQNVTIDYTYDALNRLSAADYSNGQFYHYTYDSVGNRLSQQSHLGSDLYVYDDANRLTSVNGTSYSWDNNGNLLNDGANTYTYDAANRLISVNGTTSYAYNGLGDRLTQNGVHYTLDLNTGLTQVLADGTNTYLYGLGRIAERQNGIIEYHLGDALGSVRQLTNNDGEVVLARSYDPYGNTLQSFGVGQTIYGFTGETTDANGLIYLRARHYAPVMGRFLTRDTWPGESNRPLSLNRWGYVEGNPANFVDPTGHCYVDDYSNIHRWRRAWRVWENPINGPCEHNSGPISSDQPNWHDYRANNLVCSAWLACSREEVVDALSRFTFPGQNPLEPVQPDKINFVAPFSWFPGTGFEYLGAIRSFVFLDGLRVRNASEPTHIFHKGQVDRRAFQVGEAWYVETHGTGNNIYFLMDVVNQQTGAEIFTGMDWKMRQYLEANRILKWIRGLAC